jgi:inorganic triphosphatase YgiF
MAASPPEVELKLRLPRGAAAKVLRHPLLQDFGAAAPHRARLRAVYFDTPDDRLASAGLALRLRRENGRWIQTLKGPPSGGAGALSVRPEIEADRGRGTRMPALDPAHWRATPWRPAVDAAASAGLAPRFSTDVQRTSLPVAFLDGTSATLAVDVGTIRAGRAGTTPVSELEIELGEGSIDTLFLFARTLALDVPMGIEPRSKAARGYALARRAVPQPVRAGASPIDASMDAATALRAIVGSCLAQLVANADGLAEGDDVEWIHQLRIATRRLRAALGLLRDDLPAAELAPVIEDARWMARALAPARDLDVLLDTTLPVVRRALGDDRARLAVLDGFAARAAPLRDAARGAARAAVATPRYADLVLGAGALASAVSAASGATPGARERLAVPVARTATALLKARHRTLAKRGRALDDAGDDELHAARLAAKKLRYVAEFFAPVLDAHALRAYRRALVRLQDTHGEHNDLAVALRLGAAIDGPDGAIVHLLREEIARGAKARQRTMQRRWTAFAKAPRPAAAE